MLDEKALRKPGFRPDVPVTLADGQVWHLPKPRVKTARKKLADGSRGVGRVAGVGEDYDRLLDRFYEAEVPEFIRIQFDLVALLLQQNYALSDDEIDSLVVLDMNLDGVSPEDLETRDVLQRTIQGLGPKPTDYGDGPE